MLIPPLYGLALLFATLALVAIAKVIDDYLL